MSTCKTYITPELLRQLLRYDPDSGRLIWKARDMRFCATEKSCKAWNTKFAGKEAGCHDGYGYIKLAVFEKKIQAHRAVWAIVHGVWPTMVDHINHNGMDNRIANLRDVGDPENSKNKEILRTNTSGVTGVYWDKLTRKWRAKIYVSRKCIHLGLFENIDDAILARKDAELIYGFHDNHGKKLQKHK